MAYWLLKTEPGDFSFDDLEREGSTVWDGVGNNLALQYIRQARRGDKALIYHSGKERSVVGIAEIVSNPYPDPGRADERLAVFDLRADQRLSQPVPLSAIKKDQHFAELGLVRIPRLSVMPVPAALWRRLLKLGDSTGEDR